MCLFETKLKNPHYLANEKNKGVPPALHDKRLAYIGVGCGWCKECRKQVANNWRIRLLEEYKDNTRAEFVTLSFSPEAIEKLEKDIHTSGYKELNGEELDVNILASYAIRMWTERWRKKFKRANRHWIVTELGHKNSERIHLHGIIWQTHERISRENFRNEIVKSWKYGNVYIGKFVNESTMNYITKYLTKNDAIHEGYKPRTFVSKGLGVGYIERKGIYENTWKEEETRTTYKMHNGQEYPLPRYYKDKLFTPEQKEKLWQYTLNKGEIYLNGDKWDKQRSDEETERRRWEQSLNAVRETGKRAGYKSNKQIPYKYIITEAMKRKYKECNILHDNMVAKVKRRNIKRTIEYIEVEEISKSWGVERQILGEYIGTTTAGERKRNAEMAEAEEMHISLRELRLIKKGIIAL